MRVALLQGGPSNEAEVSRASARGVGAALREAGHDVTVLELQPQVARTLLDGAFDVVFPVTHGFMGEDGRLQGFLDVLGMPYVGSSVAASALAMDKVRAKQAFRAAGVPVVEEAVAVRGQDLHHIALKIIDKIGENIVVKPASGGSAIGVTLLRRATVPQVQEALDRTLQIAEQALCERLVIGRELTCGVLDVGELCREPVIGQDGSPCALPVTEILPNAADHYDFVSKYAPGGSDHVCPAALSADLTAQVQRLALKAHRAVGARDMSRVDILLDRRHEQALYVLEVNAIPGMTSTSLYPEAAAAAGVSFPHLCDALVRHAVVRGTVTSASDAPKIPTG